MKRPTTPADWARILKTFEQAYIVLIADAALQPHERDGLYSTHTLLRTRASEEQAS